MDILKTLLEHGGVAMWAIAAGSVLSVALGLERWLFLRGYAKGAAALHDEVSGRLEAGDFEGARRAAEQHRTAAARVYRDALAAAHKGRDPAGAADRARRRVVASLRSGMWLQGTLGATMPFIGLFGTVVGVLEAFEQISKAGTGGFAVVAGAISEALITTAGGIAVAVEAVILYNVFGAIVSTRALELGLATEELVERLQTADAPKEP